MTIRGTTTYDTYPWDDDVPLVAGAFEDSGIIENLKRLENQLRYLTRYLIDKGSSNFNTYEGTFDFLYETTIKPIWTVSEITHTGYTISHVHDWIDALRSDYGVAAWSWSTDFLNGGIIALNHIKEAWRACGIVSLAGRTYADALLVYDRIGGGIMFSPDVTDGFTILNNSTLFTRTLLYFAESTKAINKYSLLVYNHTANTFSGSVGGFDIASSTYDSGSATNTWNSASVELANTPVYVTGYNEIDLSSFYYDSGTGPAYYQFKFNNESAPIFQWQLSFSPLSHYSLLGEHPYLFLWQPELTNPY